MTFYDNLVFPFHLWYDDTQYPGIPRVLGGLSKQVQHVTLPTKPSQQRDVPVRTIITGLELTPSRLLVIGRLGEKKDRFLSSSIRLKGSVRSYVYTLSCENTQ